MTEQEGKRLAYANEWVCDNWVCEKCGSSERTDLPGARAKGSKALCKGCHEDDGWTDANCAKCARIIDKSDNPYIKQFWCYEYDEASFKAYWNPW